MVIADPVELQRLLRQVKTIAVIGASDKPGRPVDTVGRYLLEQEFTVIPVHPKKNTIWGLPAFSSIKHIPCPVDMINLFRAPEYIPEHACETLTLAPLPTLFWMQSGITSPAAVRLLAPYPVNVVQDRCVMVEHRRIPS